MNDKAKAFRAYKTVNEMLKDRHYIIEESNLEMNLDDFEGKFVDGDKVNYSGMRIISVHEEDNENCILVEFHDEEIRQNDIGNILEHARDNKCKRIILVHKSKISSVAAKTATMFEGVFEDFLFEDLIVNVTRHILVPQHIKLLEDEKKALLERYNVKLSQLPRLLRSDPICKYYGFEKGDVIKIIRKSETAGRYVTYRAVF